MSEANRKPGWTQRPTASLSPLPLLLLGRMLVSKSQGRAANEAQNRQQRVRQSAPVEVVIPVPDSLQSAEVLGSLIRKAEPISLMKCFS